MAWWRFEQGTFPFTPIDVSIGKGKDNTVYSLKGRKKHTDRRDVVLKMDHRERFAFPSTEEIMSRALYLKNKYEILQAFLGDFIPHTTFIVGEKQHGNHNVKHVFQVQDRIHNYRINSLTEDERNNPELVTNLHALFTKLLDLHELVRKVNASLPPEARIDLSLDLGAVSRLIKESRTLRDIGSERITPEIFDSPNIMLHDKVHPRCIDFGSGTWSNAKQATRMILMEAGKRKGLLTSTQ